MKFKFTPMQIPEVLLIEPTVFGDARGYFKESYQQEEFDKFLGDLRFVQDNESKSSYGVLRGLHYQQEPYAQSKLIRVIQGSIWDVAIDMRSTSSTYKQFVFAELSGENHMQLFIPQGFAHGFIVTSESAIVQYKTDSYYHPASEVGIHAYDPTLNIPWPLKKSDHLLSGKDQKLPFLSSMNLGQ